MQDANRPPGETWGAGGFPNNHGVGKANSDGGTLHWPEPSTVQGLLLCASPDRPAFYILYVIYATYEEQTVTLSIL